MRASRKAFADDVRRVGRINAAVKKEGVNVVEIDGKKVNLAAHAIEHGWSVEKVELAAIRAGRANSVVPGGLAYSVSAPEVTEAVFEAAVFEAGRNDLFHDDF